MKGDVMVTSARLGRTLSAWLRSFLMKLSMGLGVHAAWGEVFSP
jgi:hypothetical protein